MRYLVGIDEVGRGPLAGPVAVGVVRVDDDFDWSYVDGAKDSKQMTENSRERLYARVCELSDAGALQFAVAFTGASVIDSDGIVPAISYALAAALRGAECLHTDDVRLDGGLVAPGSFAHQTTIIRGDQTEAIISLASIVAKVERDHLMCDIAEQYSDYGFEQHKGYGTRIHQDAIIRVGLSPHHRRTFCKRWTP